MIRRAWEIASPWVVAAGFPAVLGAAGYGRTSWQALASVVLLTHVIVLALWSGQRAALLGAVSGAFVMNYCFTVPVGSLRINDPAALALLLIFAIMAIGVSTFVNREVARELAARGRRDGHQVTVGDLVIDLDRHTVTKAGAAVDLTPTEWAFLELLARNVGRLVKRDEVLRTVWGPAYAKETHYLRVYVAQLRRKLEDDPANPKRIVTTSGQGYTLIP